MEKKGIIIISIIAAVVILLIGCGLAVIGFGNSYRSDFIEKEEAVKSAQSAISVQLQSRFNTQLCRNGKGLFRL